MKERRQVLKWRIWKKGRIFRAKCWTWNVSLVNICQ